MYARVVTAQVLPGKTDEAIHIYKDSIVPAAKQQKGFQWLYYLVDRHTDKLVSLTLWDTEADMLAGEASSYLREQIAKAAPTLAGSPTTEHFEVAIQA